MSLIQTGAVWKLREITPTEKFVLFCLAEHARDDGGGCFPSITTITEETRESRASVERALASLAKGTCEKWPDRAPLIRIESGKARGKVSHYALTLPTWAYDMWLAKHPAYAKALARKQALKGGKIHENHLDQFMDEEPDEPEKPPLPTGKAPPIPITRAGKAPPHEADAVTPPPTKEEPRVSEPPKRRRILL